METWTALSVLKSILQPSRQKYNAASSGKPPIRRRQPQAPSSEFGAPRNRTTRHAKSTTSSPASAQSPSKKHSCHVYTITHLKYHGHRRRHNSAAVNSAVQPQRILITPFIFQEPAFGQPLWRARSLDSSQKGKPRRQKALRTKGIPGGFCH